MKAGIMKVGRKSTESWSGNQKVYSRPNCAARPRNGAAFSFRHPSILDTGAISCHHAGTRVESPLAPVGELRLGESEVVHGAGLETIAAEDAEFGLHEVIVVVKQREPVFVADLTAERTAEQAAADTDGLRLGHGCDGEAQQGHHNQ